MAVTASINARTAGKVYVRIPGNGYFSAASHRAGGIFMKQMTWVGVLALSAALSVTSMQAQDRPKPDNTGTNRNGGQTADQQNMTKEDRQLASQVRKAITDDKS